MTEPLPLPIRAGPSLRRGTGPFFAPCPVSRIAAAALRAAAARTPAMHRPVASRPARRLRAVAGRSLILLPAIRFRRHRHSILARLVYRVARSQSWPMTTRYRPLSDRYDRGTRPVQEPGAGLYSAGGGFAPPGSTKPADAVFALRVTIPGAFARSRSLRATLAGPALEIRALLLHRLGRFAPAPPPVARALARPRVRLGASAPSPHPCPLPPSPTGSNAEDGSRFFEPRIAVSRSALRALAHAFAQSLSSLHLPPVSF